MWKRFLENVVSFSSVKKLVLQGFSNYQSFKVKVFQRQFFELLIILTFKFKKVCGRESLDSLKV